MPEDPYSDPVTGVLRNKLGLGSAAELEAAEREITHAALILLDESTVPPSYDLPHLQEIHGLPRVFRTGDLRLIHAAACILRYSSWTSCGVRYPSAE